LDFRREWSLPMRDQPSPADVIERARTDDLPEIRSMLHEYAAWIGQDLSFQGFARELDRLPGDYVPPDGDLLIARRSSAAVGMIALRRLDSSRCEMKRLYVRPGARGGGLGRSLATRIIDEARARGYREIVLDTLPVMGRAQEMYVALGFRDIEPYYASPIAGTRYMALTLAPDQFRNPK
jgi:ribosomal protein S18 acetylase RimI-like enzyme